ncbi:hypothetical protein [Corynebacterium auriscanis]|uniref:Uncharacterized protein n=1 Tax=Corynebacterium auriscanis TaxID=99807 RepID=A0A0A2DG30_9CORY|nr:hypothetical protein [Corynebacterium auriscanis]KGM18138.1 hypothetical protein MA47_09600 [Corynebacterium auriscanis]WJY73209.1 hypothetical protein CAURIC_07980 [Corynebacterium auriscanis]
MKGDWRPGLPADVSALLGGIMALQAGNRGVDYLLGDRDTTTNSLTVVEQAMPLWVWGMLFFAGGVLVGVGMWKRHAEPIVTGATLLMATYGALAWGLLLKMIERGTPVRAFTHEASKFDLAGMIHAWPWDGWRTPTSFLAVAIMWGCIAWGTRVMQRARGVKALE